MRDDTGGALRRPDAIALDIGLCIDCGACEELAPGIMERPERIPITHASLEAMAACPVAALHWLEGTPRDGRESNEHEYADDA